MMTFKIYIDEDGILNFDERGDLMYTLKCSSDAYADQYLEHLQQSHDRLQNKKEN